LKDGNFQGIDIGTKFINLAFNVQTMKKNLLFIIAMIITFSAHSQILKKQIPDKLVVMSFDAPASQYSVVAPLLKKYGFDAIFFICEFPPNFKDSSKYMNWWQIKALNDMGFEIANHTHTHAHIGHLSKEKLLEQLQYIEHKCDLMGITKPTDFAYPGYDLSPKAVQIIEDDGYEFSRAGDSRVYDPLHDSPMLVPSWAMTDKNRDEIRSAFQEAKDGKIVVITIHGVPDIEHPWVTTSPELFEEHLKYLVDHHCKVISFRDLKQYVDVQEALKEITPDFDKPLKN